MKAFGYETDGNTLIKLEEISFQVSVDDLDRMIKFFQMCRDELDTHGVNFGHEHFKDWLRAEGYTICEVDLIVSK